MECFMPKRQVFYSFHYDADNWRASQVRNMGVIEGNEPASDNDWETIKKGGDAAIEKWIAEQMKGRTCTIVLIGANTAGRKWINHEIIKSWNDNKGIFGIYIHKLKDKSGNQMIKGNNPFDSITFSDTGVKLSTIVSTYDSPYSDSKKTYDYIKNNIATWIETAIKQRNK
jgi:hypothetical protein